MIQPTGFHLRLSRDWLVDAVSANIGAFLPTTAERALGQPVTGLLCDDAIHDIRNRLALLRNDDSVEHLLHVALVPGGKPFDLSMFRNGDDFGIDAEPSDGHAFGDATGIVEGMLACVSVARDVESIAGEAARQLRALTGFDCATIYGDGVLLGHSTRGREPSVQAMKDPAFHELAVVDCTAEPVIILAPGSDVAQRSALRQPTDLELEMLTASGARAALIVPMARDGQSWGHVACLHSTPRRVGVERRSIVRLFARIIALQIEIAELRRG